LTSLALILSVYATQLLAGGLLVARLHAGAPLPLRRMLPRALLLGPGALALQWFLFDLAGVPISLASVLWPWWVAGALAGAAALRRSARPAVRATPRPASGERALVALALLLGTVALCVGLLVPVIESDPVLNFLTIGRVFATHHGLAPDGLLGLAIPNHIEYPPLIAINEALVFLAAGDGGFLAVKPFFALALLAWLLLGVELCVTTLRARLALLAGLFVLCLPGPFGFALGGYAELRLATSLLLLILEGRQLVSAPSRAGLLRFALYAGLCAWTKNEGLALASFAVVLPLTLLRGRRLAPRVVLGGVALLLVLAWAWPAWLRANAIEHGYIVEAGKLGLGEAFARVPEILTGFLRIPLTGHPHIATGLDGLAGDGLIWPLALLLAAVGLASRRGRRQLSWPAGLLMLHIGLYVAVFAATPHQLAWHLGTAAARLLFHVTPWLLWLTVAGLAALDGRR
jgi:hypothetical protein